jgi:hypothetical protein
MLLEKLRGTDADDEFLAPPKRGYVTILFMEVHEVLVQTSCPTKICQIPISVVKSKETIIKC